MTSPIATYFVVVGSIEESSTEDANAPHGSASPKPRRDHSPVNSPPKSPSLNNSFSFPNPLKNSQREKNYVGTIIDRYPLKDHPDVALPPHIWMFCFPEGVKPIEVVTSPTPRFSCNVLTLTDATRLYVSMLTFYEPVIKSNSLVKLKDKLKKRISGYEDNRTTLNDNENSGSNSNTTHVYFPKSICILSPAPLFDTFKEYLKKLYVLTLQPNNGIPLERYVHTLISETRFPQYGNIQLQIPIGNEKVFCNIPSYKDFEVVDFPLHYLFNVLDIRSILTIVECMLSEKKILFVSSETTLLTYIIESFMSLLYPFCWPFVYVPILPFTLLAFLEAPTPFILGMNSSYLESNEDDENISEIVIVNLDQGLVKLPKENKRFKLHPLPFKTQLFDNIKKVLHPELFDVGVIKKITTTATATASASSTSQSQSPSNSNDKNSNLSQEEIQINKTKLLRRVFLEYFADMFSNWRDFLVLLEDQSESDTAVGVFNKVAFVKTCKFSSRFLDDFLATYTFELFIEEFAEAIPNIFDEACIARRKEKEFAMRTNNKNTKFIQHVLVEEKKTAVIVIDRPNVNDLNGELFNYQGIFPKFNENLYPRAKSFIRDSNESFRTNHRKVSMSGIEYELSARAAESNGVDINDLTQFVIQHIMDKLFKGSQLDTIETSQIRELFRKNQGRMQFVDILYDYKAKRSSNVLLPAAYKQLASLLNDALEFAQLDSDFATCKHIMNLGSSFSIQSETTGMQFIRNQINGHGIWQNLDFWFFTFKDELKSQEKKSTTESPNVSESEEKDLNEDNKDANREHIVFGVVVNMAYNMLNLSLRKEIIVSFANEIAKKYSLSPDQERALSAMIVKMCKFCGNDTETDDNLNLHQFPLKSPRTKITSTPKNKPKNVRSIVNTPPEERRPDNFTSKIQLKLENMKIRL